MALTDLEQLILLVLIRLGDEAYGVAVFQELERHTGRPTTLGAVYKTLARLEDKGFVISYVGPPGTTRGGRRKRHYQVRPAGRQAVAASLDAIRRLTEGLPAPLRVP